MVWSKRYYFVYILTNPRQTVLYIGVTNDLERRLSEHREGQHPSFTREYQTSLLVYYETHESVTCAIDREKQLKRLNRARKVALIEAANPEWTDLFAEVSSSHGD